MLPGAGVWLNTLNFKKKRKSESYVERIFVCNVIENLAEHGIHCLPYANTSEAIDT